MDIYETVRRGIQKADDVSVIGKSYCGNNIYCGHCGGYKGKQFIITAAIHARECYTALVVLKQIENCSRMQGDNGVYFIPLINPDGAKFFEHGETCGSTVLERALPLHREWKANAQGVDLNCNFDARWGTGAQNVTKVGAHGYIGEYPHCAPESRALKQFTERVKPFFTVSYHCMGGELYWEFFQDPERKKRDKRIASSIARHIGVKRVDGDLDSAGGYKDWCVQSLKIPAVTIELISSGAHPFAPEDFIPDVERNKDLVEFIFADHDLIAN